MTSQQWLALSCLFWAASVWTAAYGDGRFFPEELGHPGSWEARPDWLGARSQDFTLRATEEGLEFAVTEPQRGMKWTAALDQPACAEDTPYLVLQYRCTNYSTGADYLLWLNSQSHPDGLRILAGDTIRADGRWHTVAFDLTAFEVDTFQQMALQCFATDEGNARLTVARLQLAQEPPEDAEILPATTGHGLLATLNFRDPAAWRPQPTWLANPAHSYSVAPTADGLRFSVGDAGFGMKWSCDLGEELAGGYFKLRYRAWGLDLRNDYALYAAVSGGGRSPQEQYVFLLSNLQPDGQWHIAIGFYRPGTVKTLAVQVQASQPQAWMELASLEIWGRRPQVTLREICAYQPSWPTDSRHFQPVTLPTKNSASSIAQALRFTGWFDTRDISVQGIPFRTSSAGGLLSDYSRIGTMAVSVGSKYRQIYLLLGARMPAWHESSYAGAPPNVIVYPHHFVAEVEYADGFTELQIPTRLSTGRPEISAGIEAYALATDESRAIRALRLQDGHRRAAFALLGITGSRKYGPASDATRPKPAVSLSSAPAPTRESRVEAVGNDGLLVLSGALQAEFTFKPSFGLRRIVSDYLPRLSSLVQSGEVFSIRAGEARVPASQARVSNVSVGKDLGLVELDFRPGLPLVAEVKITPCRPDEIRVELLLRATEERLKTDPVVEFPLLQGGTAGNRPEDTWAFYPRRGTVISDKPFAASMPYGGMFPLQVMGFYNPSGGGLYLRTEYQDMVDRRYEMRRSSEGIEMAVRYPWWRGETLNVVIGTQAGDWHEQLSAYNQWRRTWFRPVAPRKDWFRRIFNFRQQFLHFALPKKSGMFDPERKTFRLMEVLEQDKKAFGAVDYLHIFDWGWAPETGRCGDYAPWNYLGGAENFQAAVEKVKECGIPVGLYIEGYLVSPQSSIFRRAQKWQVIKANGEPLEAFAPDINMCPWVTEWQDYLAAVYARVREQTGAVGFYIDEYGFAHDAHACYSPDHGHPCPVYAARGELETTRKVRQALGPECAIYTEEIPCDIAMQWQDGSFTYAISSVDDQLSAHRLNLLRFAVPDFKTIEIITCDRPLGDNIEALKRILFNGEAIWLEGIPEAWFDQRSLEYIRRMHAVLSENADCFTCLHPEALVPTFWQGLYANRFPSDDGKRCVWTIYWTGARSLTDKLIAVEHAKAARYRELFYGRELKVQRRGSQDVIHATVHPHEVLVLLQEAGP